MGRGCGSCTVALVAACLVPLVIFAGLAAAVGAGLDGWDSDIVRFSGRPYERSTAAPLEDALNASIGLGAAVAVVVVGVLLARRRRREALFWALAVGGVVALELPLKDIFRRPPLGDHGGGYSFPSGTAMAFAAILAAAVLTCPERWRRPIVAVGVPLAVVDVGVLVYQWWHYPSDVVAGWCVALAWVTALWLALSRAVGEPGTTFPRRRDGDDGAPTTRTVRRRS
jgi:membrane-associated phospholipid phosphatase